MEPIKVLVVDDSMVFREVISRGLSSDPRIDVVAKAVDPYDASGKIMQYRPDVMICDVEMPRMNGIEFIRQLLPQYSLPVIVVSSLSKAVFDALGAGALDFVLKPDVQSAQSVKAFILELIAKVKAALHANLPASPSLPTPEVKASFESSTGTGMNMGKIIAVGSSTGGTDAVYRVLKQLPFPMPGIVVVQHIPPVFSRMFAERLNQTTAHTVQEANTGDVLEPGKVFIAPGDKHLTVKKSGEAYKLEVSGGEKVNGHCPSVDLLFESVARAAGGRSVGVILTGMGYDGAKGLLAMKRKGARTIGQDEKSSVVYGMPKVAYEIGAVEKQAPLDRIPELLCSLLRN